MGIRTRTIAAQLATNFTNAAATQTLTQTANVAFAGITTGNTVVNNMVVSVGAAAYVNTTAVFVGNSTVNSSMTSSSLRVGGTVVANGGQGTAGQVLTSGGTGNVYWANAASGGGGGGSGSTTNALTIGNGLSTQDGDKLATWLPTDSNTSEYMGMSVATNGTYSVVAASGANGGTGYVYVYLNSTGVMQYRIGITGTISLGAKVAINSNNIIVVSETAYSGSTGRVFVFDMSTWPTYAGSLVSITSATNTLTNPQSNSYYFGNALAISSSYIVVGCWNTRVSGYSNAGVVYLYSITGTLKYMITDPSAYSNPSGDYFGWSVGISGNTLVVGAFNEGNITQSVDGAVYVFNIGSFPAYPGSTVNITSSNYTSYGFAIAVPDPILYTQSNMGYSVATNGVYVIAGAPGAKGSVRPGQASKQSVGAVYVFDASSGALVYKLNSPSPIVNAGQDFGTAVSVSGNNLLVGEPNDNAGGQGWPLPGISYMFDLADGKLKKTIFSPNSAGEQGASDKFARALSMSGNYAVIGAPYETNANYVTGSGVTYLFNVNNTFNGGTATTVALAPTSVVPGIYGGTDGTSYINVPQMSIDSYGRVVSVTSTQYTPTGGLSSAFTSVKIAGQSLTAMGPDMFELVAGSNIILSADTMMKTITISSTGGGSSGGIGGGGTPFFANAGPTAISYSMGDATVTIPATAQWLIQPMPLNESTAMVGGPGLPPFNTINGPYSGAYGPNGMVYPWYSSSSIQSGATLHISTNMSNGGNGTMAVVGYGLASSTNPAMMQCWFSGSGGSAMGGDFFISNMPQMNYGAYISQPDYFYGTVYLMGGGDLSTFTPAPGVVIYYNTTLQQLMVRVPGSIWSMGGLMGTLSGYNGSFGYSGFYFGI